MRPHLELNCTPDTNTDVNLDESRVPAFELPPLLDRADTTWATRREDLLSLFEDHVYGRVPDLDLVTAFDEFETGLALNGLATRRQTLLRIRSDEPDGVSVAIEVLTYLPASASGPVPAFLVPNFDGNHTVAADPQIRESAGARRDRGDDIAARGSKTRRFPIETILARGYGLVTFYAADVDSDADDGFANGIQRAGYVGAQTEPAADEWGTIGAWSWACSRVLDSLEADAALVDEQRVIVGGHSRLGKTALWAAARDERFAAAFSNDSGCTGAALSRRAYGENVAVINALFPHWFCRNYRCYSNDEDALPIDQHHLLALVAPRPVHVGSASEDAWADPLGEFLAAKAATDAWALAGSTAPDLVEFPAAGAPATIGPVSYHLRDGEHDLLEFDWAQYLDFADAQLRA